MTNCAAGTVILALIAGAASAAPIRYTERNAFNASIRHNAFESGRYATPRTVPDYRAFRSDGGWTVGTRSAPVGARLLRSVPDADPIGRRRVDASVRGARARAWPAWPAHHPAGHR